MGQAVVPEKKLLAIDPSWCILCTCKEQVKFSLFQGMSTEEMSTPAVQCRCPCLPLNKPLCLPSLGQSCARISGLELAVMWPRSADAWERFLLQGHGWVRARLCSAGRAEGVQLLKRSCCGADPLAASIFRLFLQQDSFWLCFTPLISTNFVLKFI